MKISDLPPGLRELSELRRTELAVTVEILEQDVLSKAFSWSATPEDAYFWANVNDGNFDAAYGCRLVNPRPKQLGPEY